MSKLWLPFYDLGGSVGKGQNNHPLDVALCQFLFTKTTQSVNINLPQQNAWAFNVSGANVVYDWAGTKGDKWIKFAENFYRTVFGATIAPMESGVIRPYGQEKSLILAMNKKFHQLYGVEYLSPSFGNVVGSMSHEGLLGHMCRPGSTRSAWLGISAANAGPQRELPFYDVKTLMQYQPANLNPVVDPLVGYLFKVIYNGRSKARPEDVEDNLLSPSPNVAVVASVVPKFTKKFIELGWNCLDKNHVHPTKGNLNSMSAIVPANFFAHMVAVGKTVSGMLKPGYFNIFDSSGLPPQTKQTMFDCRESRYFEVELR